eukprot:2745704-Rhodomonas_salina.3
MGAIPWRSDAYRGARVPTVGDSEADRRAGRGYLGTVKDFLEIKLTTSNHETSEMTLLSAKRLNLNQ